MNAEPYSRLRVQCVTPDDVWHGEFAVPGGHTIYAFLNLRMTEIILRVRADGVREEVPGFVPISKWQLWWEWLSARVLP